MHSSNLIINLTCYYEKNYLLKIILFSIFYKLSLVKSGILTCFLKLLPKPYKNLVIRNYIQSNNYSFTAIIHFSCTKAVVFKY